MGYEDAETEIASELDIYNLTTEHMYEYMSEKQIEFLKGRIITLRKLEDDTSNFLEMREEKKES